MSSDKSSTRSDRRPQNDTRDQRHHTHEWASGTRGGGKVPDDFGWKTNPKQDQEERGTPASRQQQPPEKK